MGRRGRPRGTRAGGGRERERGRGGNVTEEEARYLQWKLLIPVLYDWLDSHNLVWPSLSCRWGPQFGQRTYKNLQRLSLSEQTDGSVPNTLVIANCEVVKPRFAAAEQISQFKGAPSPFVKKFKTILHPGEVNRIRELPQNNKIVATHSDSPDVLVWDVESQPNRPATFGAAESHPDLDKSVILWSIQDHISTLGETASKAPATSSSTQPRKDSNENRTVGPRGVYPGHENTIEDVQFCPFSVQEFCSVGDDSCLILWDARIATIPVMKVEKAHNADIHCVDWNPHDENLILTGSADNSLHMFDLHNIITSAVLLRPYISSMWSPDKQSVFGSAAEDGLINIWDHEKVGKKQRVGTRMANSPPGLFFQHLGHRNEVVDFQWNASEISDGTGTLQMWRMSDLIYRPEGEVLEELKQYKDRILSSPGS